MKTLLIISCLASLNCLAQSDSTAYRIGKLEKEISYIKNNLDRAHSQYKTGIYLNIAGSIALIGSVFAQPSLRIDGSKDYFTRNLLIYGGSILSFCGIVIVIDSHKFIGRAGQ